MNKKRALFLILLSMFVLSGCVKMSESDVAPTREVNHEEGNLKKADNAVREFIYLIEDQSFEGIKEKVYLPEGAFLSDADIEWYILRSDFSDITGTGYEPSGISINGTSVEKTASFKLGKKSYSLDLRLGSDNTWKICMDDAYFENWTLKVPKGCRASCDGLELTEYMRNNPSDEDADSYIFPAISIKPHELSITSSLYGSFKMTVTPKSSSETYTAVCRIGDAETNNILKSIQFIWNSLYEAYVNGDSVPSIRRYFADGYDTNMLTELLTVSFPELTKGPGRTEYKSFYMSDVRPWDQNNYGAAILHTDDSVSVHFGYKTEFSDTEGNYHNCNKVTTINMIYENGTYKIQSLPDQSLFSYNDYTRNDF